MESDNASPETPTISDEWLSALLSCETYESCEAHDKLKKNEKNVFCVDCKLCMCKHCVLTSCDEDHRHLQICKYVYQDAVRHTELRKFVDCSKIQTYKSNSDKAIILNPKPLSRDPKQGKVKGGPSCVVCGRFIQDLPNEFCSLACKFQVSEAIAISLQESRKMTQEQASNPSKTVGFRSLARQKKRKGTPYRSPFF